MKKNLLLIIAFTLLWSFKVAAEKNLDFSYPGNWVICEKNIRENCEVDLFYVLPTIYADKNNAYMRWHDNKAIQVKALMIDSQHTGIFSGYSRIFAPYYRQAEFRRILREIDLPVEKQTFIHRGINDVREAFRYYMKHYNKGASVYSFGLQSGICGIA